MINQQIKSMETIQFIPSTMACERMEEEKLRSDLDKEMEAFLKRGGKIQKLKSGQSGYKNNIQPLRQAVYERAKATPDSVIEEKNKKIREGKVACVDKKERKPKARMSVEFLDSIQSEQKKMLSEFDKKLDILSRKRFCDELGISKKFYMNAKCGDSRIGVSTWEKAKELMKTFVIISKPENTNDRLYELAEAKKEALEKGLVFFEATCQKHGKTGYKITSNNIPRCVECTKEGVKRRSLDKLSQEQLDNAERKEFNRVEMNKALSNGVKLFDGKCKVHGICGFTVTRGVKSKSGEIRHQYKCKECKKGELARHKEKHDGSKNNA